MTKILCCALTSTVAPALIVTASAGMAPAAPSKAALLARERSAYEAWNSKDVKFWDGFLSEKFVGWGSTGRLDKASATKEYTGSDCHVERYSLSNEQVRRLGSDAALITYKTTVSGTCSGTTIPPTSWAAGIYVREGEGWKAAFHGDAAVVDPTAAPAQPVAGRKSPEEGKTQATPGDDHSEALLTIEKAVWEAWKAHDAKTLEGLTAKHVSFINVFGSYLATKADALKNWSGAGCDVKTVGVTDAVATMLSPRVGILTFKAAADGTCFGQKVGPIRGTSVYVEDGGAWKWTFGINVPVGGEGA
jgi:hypothetical protein